MASTLLYRSPNFSANRREFDRCGTQRPSRYDSYKKIYSNFDQKYESPTSCGTAFYKPIIGSTGRRSVSLHRHAYSPPLSTAYSILDEIIDRRSVKNQLDDAIYNYQKSKENSNKRKPEAIRARSNERCSVNLDKRPNFSLFNHGICIDNTESVEDKVQSKVSCDTTTEGENDQATLIALETVRPRPTSTDRASSVKTRGNIQITELEQNHVNDELAMPDKEMNENWNCSKCRERCPGFKPHRWRSACDNCHCSSKYHEKFTLDHTEQQQISNYVMEKPTARKIRSFFIGGASEKSNQPKTSGSNQTQSTNIVQQQQQRQQQQQQQQQPQQSHAQQTLQQKPTIVTPQSPYTWTPPGLIPSKIEEYMSQLPNHKVPRVGTSGEKYREKQLMLQLPRQDLATSYCKHLANPQEQAVFEDFINIRNENALDIGFACPSLEKSTECHKCKGFMSAGETAVFAPKLPSNWCWHPGCFCCTFCDELLVDLTYCVTRDEKIYCERHYAETIKPRCGACDELIFAGEYTKAMNQDWHSDHFCCWQCDQVLTGQRYILRDDHPYCIKCYEDVFANTCDECGKAIGIDSKDLSYKDKHWHESCFLCSMCKVSLVDKPFGSKNDRIFCANCYDQAFATRCDGCGEIFKAGMKKMEYKGKQWHDKCFCCALCKSPIGTRSFIPKNEEVFCANCYEEKFATKCTKCRKVIASGGVTYKNEPWHRECFCCRNCNVSLAGQRFTSKDDKPYCANCFGELFAKRCTLCTKPITGIGGSKFISFEERHWHNNCFVCAQCQTSLVGQGFITDGPDILCPECAKARLMAQQ